MKFIRTDHDLDAILQFTLAKEARFECGRVAEHPKRHAAMEDDDEGHHCHSLVMVDTAVIQMHSNAYTYGQTSENKLGDSRYKSNEVRCN